MSNEIAYTKGPSLGRLEAPKASAFDMLWEQWVSGELNYIMQTAQFQTLVEEDEH